MKVNIIGRQLNVWDEMKTTIEKKLEKFDKFFGDDCVATATLSIKHAKKCLELTINAKGAIFRSEVEDETFRNALDRAVYLIERQIRKNKTRLEKRSKEGEFIVPDFSDVLDEDPEFIVRTKEFELFPMSVEEAIMQMNLLGHQFFVFFNDETSGISVVYARKDGSYGLINPIIYK
jgi:putative sigma-54 modulation protein